MYSQFTIITIFTVAPRCAFLISDIALTISLNTVGFFAVASPNLFGVKFIDIVTWFSLFFHFYLFDCSESLMFMLTIIEAVFAFALFSAGTFIVETWAIELEAFGIGTITEFGFLFFIWWVIRIIYCFWDFSFRSGSLCFFCYNSLFKLYGTGLNL